jgi:2-polyprenyl-3-methyl-5-hydroxy-6-metoxy-1,4-benzoquinol methylase
MDVDRQKFHDFYNLDEINETFDMVFLFEVIEHLSLYEGIEVLRKIYTILNPRGRLILTTPNIFNPGRFLRDVSHRTAYCYDELGGASPCPGISN